MPLARKHNRNNPFKCPSCTQIFQTRGGLSQHYRKKHHQISSPLIDLSDNHAIPLSLEAIGIPPDIAQIAHSCPQDTSSSSESETGDSSIISGTFNNNLRSPPPGRDTQDDDLYTSSDAEDSDFDNQIDIDVDDGLAKLPEALKFGNVLPHPNAGFIYDVPGQEYCSLKIQEQDHKRFGHPYHPWTSENELWLSHFMFFKAKMTVGMADVMMKAVRDGQLKIDGLTTTRARKLLAIIDEGAEYVPVSSVLFFTCKSRYNQI
jgi:hypothetical protein